MLLEPKLISTAQPLYTVCSPTSMFHLEFTLKMIMDSSKNGTWIITFEKFSRLKVKTLLHIILSCQVIIYMYVVCVYCDEEIQSYLPIYMI